MFSDKFDDCQRYCIIYNVMNVCKTWTCLLLDNLIINRFKFYTHPEFIIRCNLLCCFRNHSIVLYIITFVLWQLRCLFLFCCPCFLMCLFIINFDPFCLSLPLNFINKIQLVIATRTGCRVHFYRRTISRSQSKIPNRHITQRQ